MPTNEETVEILEEIRSPNIKASLVNGVFNGIGFVIGSTVVVALAVIVLRPFITLPVIGDALNQIIEAVESKRPQQN